MSFLLIAAFVISIPIGSAFAESNFDVIIPKGAGNPSYDPQFKKDLFAEEWYVPTKLTVSVNDTVTWVNQDTDKHTVTSGQSSGRAGGVTGVQGISFGIFDSGLFGQDESWSYKFKRPGTFPYFCTIHPWMYGIVVAEGPIPKYPHDVEGNRLTLPAMTISSDGKYHTGLYWNPVVIRTGDQVLFTLDFFKADGSTKLHALEYDFVIIQNGKEIHRSNGFSEGGSDTKYFVFTEPGPIKIRFENIGKDKFSVSEFNTVAYGNSTKLSADAIISKNKGEPIIYQTSLWVILAAPVILIIGIIWFAKKKH
ncbi:MAG: plastocyanin/azurin family copper-binding protein [Candidatus Nitrosotenuis sp.]